MFDYDVVIIGGGPAGLTAGLYLGRGNRRTLVIEKAGIGGNMQNVSWVENYPGFAEGVAGARLASEMANQAMKYGVNIKAGDVTGIEVFSQCKYVATSGGSGYSTSAVIIAGGCRHKKLGVPGEAELTGKGVFSCALCDGARFSNRVVAVCGGGDSGVTEALYMLKLASRVILIEAMPELTASAILRERAENSSKLEIIRGAKVGAIHGKESIEAIDIIENGQERTVPVDGVLVQVGIDPDTDYLKDTLSLDDKGQIVVNERMETNVPYILAAGDIRSGSPRQVVTAVGDGATAAITAERLMASAQNSS